MAIDVLTEEVASNLEEVAEATRRLNTAGIGYFLAGSVMGLGFGFYVGYKFNREKLKAEAFATAEAEVAEIREVYHQKIMASEPKPDLNEKVQELGYSVKVPDEIRNANQEQKRPLRPPVPVDDPPTRDPIIVTKDKNDGWDYPKELEGRTPYEPYIIHQDEWTQGEREFSQVVYTYYVGDDILVDSENSDPIPHPDMVVGVENLKWGHGSDDMDVVFVRNDRLELDIQICRSRASYEEEVLGLSNDNDNA